MPGSYKGRYTRGVLLPEHSPGSFCTCQYTRGAFSSSLNLPRELCSQIFNRLNIVEFCGVEILLPRMKYTHEAKSLVCFGLKSLMNIIDRSLINIFYLCQNSAIVTTHYSIPNLPLCCAGTWSSTSALKNEGLEALEVIPAKIFGSLCRYRHHKQRNKRIEFNPLGTLLIGVRVSFVVGNQ